MLDNIPKTLYKYRYWNDSYHQRVLTHQEVFLSSPAGLNDPFDASLPFRYNPEDLNEGNIYLKLIEIGRKSWPDISEQQIQTRAFKEQHSGKFEDGAFWKDQHEKLKANLHASFGLLSLTSKADNLLMWAHYANSHRGFCVGFDRDILFDVVKGTLGPVNYQEDFPFVPMFPPADEPDTTMIRLLNTKSPHWLYENEFRLTRHGASNKVFRLPAEGITEIVLGASMNPDDRKAIIATIDEQLPHVRIFEARTSLEKFQIDLFEAIKV
ncbi:DUF2971 domain-containing protein [Pedobacter sp. 22226]|uniref:DUF2971 domain-containing protein n=1 Tax=Pedobacter sp. 22226 TaxID=3453894 RepID=UPI003F8256BC